jgi:hypothetical protein
VEKFEYTSGHGIDYTLTVGDRFRQGGERFYYRLTVRRDEPDFELSTTADTVVVTPDKPGELPIKVARRGKVGAITLQALGLPPGIIAAPVVSASKGATAAAVTLKITTTGPAFSGPIRIVGKTDQPRTIERFVRTPPRLGAAFESIWVTALEKRKKS